MYYAKYPFFVLDSKLFAISRYNRIYYTKDWNRFNAVWNSLSPEDIFGQGNNLDPQFNNYDQDAILMVHIINDTTGYFILGKLKETNVPFSKKFKLNFVKIYPNKFTNIEEITLKPEQSRVYLWNSSPYPLPSGNIVSSKIYRNKPYKIEDAKINVYDIFGTKLI